MSCTYEVAILGNGFIAKALNRYLESVKIKSYIYKGLDLTDWRETDYLTRNLNNFKYVFNLTGYNGGIAFNKENKHEIFRINSLIALNLISSSVGKKYKLINMITSCAYPNGLEEKKPEDILKGEPEENVEGHGYARRNMWLTHKFYSEKADVNSICICPNTVYGPGDSLDPNKAKVMGSLFSKIISARDGQEKSVTLWGDGSPLREFIYIDDLVKLLYEAATKYNSSAILNLADPGKELCIKDLAHMIKGITKYNGEILFDNSKPNGQMRKKLDLTRMKFLWPNFEFTPLYESLVETGKYYDNIWFGSR